jgi:hypothetical protein
MPIPRQRHIETIARMSRKTLAKDGFLNQLAYIWKGDNFVVMGGMPIGDQASKKTWAWALRRACLMMEADTVLTVTEAWCRPVNPDIPDDMMGPVEGQRGAYEGVIFHLETLDGTWACIVPIIRVPGQGPAFPMPRFWGRGEASGTLSGFIPDKKASAYQGEQP